MKFLNLSYYFAELRFAAQAIPAIPTHFSVAWSVCLSCVTFVYFAWTVCRILYPIFMDHPVYNAPYIQHNDNLFDAGCGS